MTENPKVTVAAFNNTVTGGSLDSLDQNELFETLNELFIFPHFPRQDKPISNFMRKNEMISFHTTGGSSQDSTVAINP